MEIKEVHRKDTDARGVYGTPEERRARAKERYFVRAPEAIKSIIRM